MYDDENFSNILAEKSKEFSDFKLHRRTFIVFDILSNSNQSPNDPFLKIEDIKIQTFSLPFKFWSAIKHSKKKD